MIILYYILFNLEGERVLIHPLSWLFLKESPCFLPLLSFLAHQTHINNKDKLACLTLIWICEKKWRDSVSEHACTLQWKLVLDIYRLQQSALERFFSGSVINFFFSCCNDMSFFSMGGRASLFLSTAGGFLVACWCQIYRDCGIAPACCCDQAYVRKCRIGPTI